MYHIFPHTADVGIAAEADSREALFADMAEGLFSLIIEDPTTIRPAEEVTIDLTGDELDFLLFDWLNELLYQFDAHRLVLRDFAVTFDNHGLQGRATGEPWDENRHVLSHEVKAITYHELRVWQEGTRWKARVIVDI